jgi:glycosyltransferase
MKISIITATFNSAAHIAGCITSVNEQTDTNIEHIIVDGASKDNTLEIIRSIPNRVTRIVSEPDKGIYDAMNKGIRLATGDVIGILNSDDFYASNDILERIMKTFETENCNSVYGNLDFVAPNNPSKVIRHWKSSPFVRGSFAKGWHPPHPAFFVKREIYEKYGLFDTSLNVSADFELMLRFLEKHNISTHYLDETIVKMRYGGVSTTSLNGILTGNKNILKALKKNGIKVSPFYTVNRFLNKAKQFIQR